MSAEQDIKKKRKHRGKRNKRKHQVLKPDSISKPETLDYDGDEPVEKKIKKPKKEIVIPTDSAGKKITSIRQMKREKFAERRAQAQEAVKESLKQECHNYLSQWKHAKDDWKFMKAKQLRLYENKFNVIMVSDEIWPTWLEYFNSAAEPVKKRLIEEANLIIKKNDEYLEMCADGEETKEKLEKSENSEESKEEKEIVEKPDPLSYKRARDIIQCIEE